MSSISQLQSFFVRLLKISLKINIMRGKKCMNFAGAFLKCGKLLWSKEVGLGGEREREGEWQLSQWSISWYADLPYQLQSKEEGRVVLRSLRIQCHLCTHITSFFALIVYESIFILPPLSWKSLANVPMPLCFQIKIGIFWVGWYLCLRK